LWLFGWLFGWTDFSFILLVSFTPWHFYPRYQRNRRMVGNQKLPGCFRAEKIQNFKLIVWKISSRTLTPLFTAPYHYHNILWPLVHALTFSKPQLSTNTVQHPACLKSLSNKLPTYKKRCSALIRYHVINTAISMRLHTN
jgi:hypothetical protein